MSVYKRTIVSKDGKKSLYWYVEVSSPNGKKIKRSIGKVGEMTKAVARKVELELKHKIKLGQWDMIQANIPTFNEFISEYIDYQKNIKQNRRWELSEYAVKLFAKYYGGLMLSEITPSVIDDYKDLMLSSKKPATVNRELAAVRNLFFFARKRRRFFGENPVSEAGLLPGNNQKERILTVDEENLLLANAKEPLKSIIKLALLTGLRRNEIRTLKWDNIDLTLNTITIDATHSKNKKLRYLPISTAVRKLLPEIKLRCGGSVYLFPKAVSVTSSCISMLFRSLCMKIHIQGLRFHDLRHTAATRMIESGIGIDKVSRILGHANIQMTMRYSHPDNSLREAVEALANFKNPTTNITTNKDLSDAN